MNKLEELLAAYEVDVDFPDVSGMEHLQMLITRSQLHRLESRLSPVQKHRLKAADHTLIRKAGQFFLAIQAIADLPQWRESEDATPDQWWWYLDVLSQLPEGADVSPAKTVTT